MLRFNYPERSAWAELCIRPSLERGGLSDTVRRVIEDVRAQKDEALLRLTAEFDKVELASLRVLPTEFDQATELLAPELRHAIELAANNIESFHRAQMEPVTSIETMPGIRCWRKSTAISPVGFYVPGGTAPLFSTLLMLGIPSKLAGCEQRVVCSPPSSDGSLHPAILFTAKLCGITEVFKVGGAQAIAAMAYGTESIPKTFKIFGPGNQYVTMAKQLVQEDGVGIDMPAGPSELAVIADESSDIRFVVADLLSQAEHGPDSQVMLVSTSARVLDALDAELEQQLQTLPRAEIARAALESSRAILLESTEDAMAFVNFYAPEHLIIATETAEVDAEQVKNAGSVFIGPFAPESVGDYASGTNHVLPTAGYAAVSAGVSLDSFVKKITFQQLSKSGLQGIAGAVATMASAEGLEAHRRAVEVRLAPQDTLRTEGQQ